MSTIPQSNIATTDPVGSPKVQQPQAAKAAVPGHHGGEYDDKDLPPGIDSATISPTQLTVPRNAYPVTTPLSSLQQGPTPVDCPSCGTREMSRTAFVTGGTTQWV